MSSGKWPRKKKLERGYGSLKMRSFRHGSVDLRETSEVGHRGYSCLDFHLPPTYP